MRTVNTWEKINSPVFASGIEKGEYIYSQFISFETLQLNPDLFKTGQMLWFSVWKNSS